MTDRVHQQDPHRPAHHPKARRSPSGPTWPLHQRYATSSTSPKTTGETGLSLLRDVPPARPLEEWAEEILGPLTPAPAPAPAPSPTASPAPAPSPTTSPAAGDQAEDPAKR